MTPLKYLTASESLQLIAQLNRYDTRDSLLIRLALETGARCSELLALTRQDYMPEAQAIIIKGLKGSRDRVIPILNPETVTRLSRHIKSTLNERLFCISPQRFRVIWYHWRPARKKLHALRHTCAVELYQKTKDLKLVQLILGHKSLTSTQVYLDVIYDLDEMRRRMLRVG